MVHGIAYATTFAVVLLLLSTVGQKVNYRFSSPCLVRWIQTFLCLTVAAKDRPGFSPIWRNRCLFSLHGFQQSISKSIINFNWRLRVHLVAWACTVLALVRHVRINQFAFQARAHQLVSGLWLRFFLNCLFWFNVAFFNRFALCLQSFIFWFRLFFFQMLSLLSFFLSLQMVAEL